MSSFTLVYPRGFNKSVTFLVSDVAVDIFESGRRTRRVTKDAARKCYREFLNAGFKSL